MLTILATLILIGVVLWAINTYVPMQPPLKGLFNAVVLILVLVWLFGAFGIFPVPGVTAHKLFGK